MASIAKRLYQGQPGITSTTLYTVPTTTPATTTILKQVVANNVSGAVVFFDLYLVPSGGSATVANSLVYQVPIQPHAFVLIDYAQDMDQGDSLRAIASVAAALTLTISGIEEQ